jgi:hypothetical protein
VGASLHSPVERIPGIDLAFVLQTPKGFMRMYLVDGPLDPTLDWINIFSDSSASTHLTKVVNRLFPIASCDAGELLNCGRKERAYLFGGRM